MIIDYLDNFGNYISLHKNFKLVYDYLKTHNLADLECGKYKIKDDEVFINLQEYETKSSQKLEAHKKYIDIQIVVKGQEYMGYTNIEKTNIIEEYDKQKDVIFLKGDIDKLKTDNKTFVIFYPQDAHMPALSIKEPEYVKKAIFKIEL